MKKNNFEGLNVSYKRDLKGQMEIIGKLASNKTSNIGILPSASENAFIKLVYECIHILNNKEMLNGLKGSTKT